MRRSNSLTSFLKTNGGEKMKVLEKGNYKVRNWKLKAECTGEEWKNKNKPCHSILELEDGDIVKRKYTDRSYHGFRDWVGVAYGFICCECHAFTEIDEKLVPDEIKEYCPQVATKDSSEYEKLTEREKELSKFL